MSTKTTEGTALRLPVAAVVAARRQARAVAGGDQCASCHGLGYRNPEAPHQP